jgi:hypothetical protein
MSGGGDRKADLGRKLAKVCFEHGDEVGLSAGDVAEVLTELALVSGSFLRRCPPEAREIFMRTVTEQAEAPGGERLN